MSLRHQILFRILLSSVLILLLGGGIAVWQARKSVDKEVDASIRLALQLITLGVEQAPVLLSSDDLAHFSALQQTRHLRIELQKPDGQLIQFSPRPSSGGGQSPSGEQFPSGEQSSDDTHSTKPALTPGALDTLSGIPSPSAVHSASGDQHADAAQTKNPLQANAPARVEPPGWFVRLVQGDYPKLQHRLQTRDGQTLTLIIQAQPLDEISEVWQETVEYFASILLLTVLTFMAVNLVFNKSLKSIAVIVDALQAIETGHYQQPLPAFAVAEFDKIARAINHLMVELDKTHQQLQALTQHSLAIQEEERQRLSQELHDELGQSLTAIKVMAVTAARPGANIENISVSISEICEHLINVVRGMMQQLHPLVLTELGLKATLEELVHHWSTRNTGLKLSIACSDELDYLDKGVSIQVFRIIQECLTNVVRHAQASRVDIELELQEFAQQTRLVLAVKDNGQGCDLHHQQRGFGLLSMRERIHSLNGVCQYHSEPGQGMCVNAWIPIL